MIRLGCSLLMLCSAMAAAQEKPVRLNAIEVDRAAGEVRVECEVLDVSVPLEFFCVKAGGPEHETILRTKAVPADIHAALLLIGLKPGEPLRQDPASKKWLAPHGPEVDVSVRWTDAAGQRRDEPAWRMMRSLREKATMPKRSWVFTGSKPLADGRYGADTTGYIVSLVNFEFTPLDVGEIASNSNETLLWEADPTVRPPAGTMVTMVLKPAAPTTRPAAGP